MADCGFTFNGQTFQTIEDLKKYLLSNVSKEELLSNIKTEADATEQREGLPDEEMPESGSQSERVNTDQREQEQAEGTETEQGADNSDSSFGGEQEEEIANENMDDDNEYVGNDEDVDEMNEERQSNGVEFNEDAFRNTVANRLGKGYTQEDIVDFYKQVGYELSDRQKEIIQEQVDAIPTTTTETEEALNDFQRYLNSIKSGRKIRAVARRLSGVAAINGLNNIIEANRALYKTIPLTTLTEMANYYVDALGVDAAVDFLNNQKANDALIDVRTLLQARVFNDLLKDGRRQEAAEIWSQMAEESTLAGRRISSTQMAYSILNAGNIDAQFKRMAIERKAASDNAKVAVEQERLESEMGKQGTSEIKSKATGAAKDALNSNPVAEKIANWVKRICRKY